MVRIRNIFRLITLVSLAGVTHSNAHYTIYSTSEEFQAKIANSYTETFAGNEWGEPGVPGQGFSDQSFSFDLTTLDGELNAYPLANMEDHNWEGSGMRNSERDTPMVVDNLEFNDGPVTAIGGKFFYTHYQGEFVLDLGIRTMLLTVTFEHGDPLEIVHSPSNYEEAFLGVTTSGENRVTSLSFGVDSGAANRHTTTSEITVGVIPEPKTYGLFASLLVMGAVIVRSRRLRAESN